MQAIGRQPQGAPDGAPVYYERHRPAQTTLYRLVQQHAASLIAHTPDILRFGFAGLYVRYVDVWDAVAALKAVMQGGEWNRSEFITRKPVT